MSRSTSPIATRYAAAASGSLPHPLPSHPATVPRTCLKLGVTQLDDPAAAIADATATYVDLRDPWLHGNSDCFQVGHASGCGIWEDDLQ